MLKKGIRYLGIMYICFLLCMILPETVKAEESVTGGATFQEAVQIEWNKEYRTTNAEGWFKVYAPENTMYIGAGYDEFTSVDAYDDAEENIYKSSLTKWLTRTKLGINTTYWDSHNNSLDLEGDCYYYFEITSAKTDNCTFRLVYGAYYPSENREVIQLRQEYVDSYYLSSTFYPPMGLEYGFYSSNYQFVAANTRNYKIILKSKNGAAKCKLKYKDGSEITVIDCEKNSVTEKIISVRQGVTYYVETWASKIDDNSTNTVDVTFQVSNAKVSSITLNTNALTMNKGEQFMLTANVAPENAVDKSITYTSSNPTVAVVSQEGIVTAVRGGSAIITADANDGSGVQAMCNITVIPKLVNRLDLDGYYIEQDLATFDDENYYYQLVATTYPTDADNNSVTYTSSNTSVVSVNKENGMLTLKKPGTAVITCRTNDGSNLVKTCEVVLTQSRLNGYKKTIDNVKYKVTSDTIGGGTVTVYGVSNKNLKSYTIQNSITIDGYSYKITGIHDKAFKNCKKATSIVLGNNIKSIGKETFCNCRKLKSLTIKSKKLKTVGKNAFKNIHSKAKIKVPSSKLSKYKKIMKDKGQKKTVKIKKM